ncbi:MAG: enoyl-CoA hydratase/isomerase family protein, partial [Reyranella sp.]|nr:enoyl-CoA hydratase/isomerase family protein [Reyranella sp.]
MTDMTYNTILLSRDNGLATITLNAPDKLNAVSRKMIAEIKPCWEELAADSSVRAVLLTGNGRPYAVFTPYKNAWLREVNDFYLRSYPVERHAAALAPLPQGLPPGVPELAAIGFETTNLRALKIATGTQGARGLFEDFVERIDRYHQARDFPAIKGPSYLSVHLRFGTLSIRQVARVAWQ